MGFVEGVAFVLAVLVLLETIVLVVAPESILDFAKVMAKRRNVLMVVYLLLGMGLLYGFLGRYSFAEIVGLGTVLVIFYGIMLLPFYDRIIEVFESSYEDGELLRRFGPGLAIWIFIALAVIGEFILNLV